MDNGHTQEKQRIALVLQYVGTHFQGWQRQPQRRTVQAELEDALYSILNHPVHVCGAGRTDSGVHAAGQVAHFDTRSQIPPERWATVLNNRLPNDIVVRASTAVPPKWHARFCAKSRRYRYTLYTGKQPNLFVSPFSWHYYYAPIDESLIQAALNPLMGSHHLAAFHRAGSQRTHSWVDVQDVECYRQGPFVYIEVQANAFLYGMMRLLVGMLVQVGRTERSLANFYDIWKNECREAVKYAAPAHGLCLLRVSYPDLLFPLDTWFDTMPRYQFSNWDESRCQSDPITSNPVT
jgi:tRNA pseudouridine38-40 synthase